jgi:hypothetical protein
MEQYYEGKMDGGGDGGYQEGGYPEDGYQPSENKSYEQGPDEGKTSGGGGAAIELEHAIGFNGSIPSGLWCHPNGKDFIYPAGGCLVVCDFNDPHNQVFLVVDHFLQLDKLVLMLMLSYGDTVKGS